MSQHYSFAPFEVSPPPLSPRQRRRWSKKKIAGAAVTGFFVIGLIGNALDNDTTDTATSAVANPSATAPITERTSPATGRPATVSPVTASPIGTPRANLATLQTTKGRAPRTGYDRAKFGQTWTDDVTVEFGHNGCDTRNDILRRDLRGGDQARHQ